MVKLFALSVFYKGSNEAKLLKSAYDLQSFSFFQRSSVQEFIGYGLFFNFQSYLFIEYCSFIEIYNHINDLLK